MRLMACIVLIMAAADVHAEPLLLTAGEMDVVCAGVTRVSVSRSGGASAVAIARGEVATVSTDARGTGDFASARSSSSSASRQVGGSGPDGAAIAPAGRAQGGSPSLGRAAAAPGRGVAERAAVPVQGQTVQLLWPTTYFSPSLSAFVY